MFSKKANGQLEQAGASGSDKTRYVPSIVSDDLTIKGNLVSKGEIQVDGKVDGNINCKALIVGRNGFVSGQILAQTVRIHGSIKGLVKANSVFLASTANMTGDIDHESLAIEPGAFVDGHCKRMESLDPPPKSQTKTKPVSIKSSSRKTDVSTQSVQKVVAS